MQTVDLNVILQDVIEAFRVVIADSGLRLTVNLPDEPIW
jgi:hypothetical protein